MAPFAQTDIKHGRADGEVIIINVGDEVTEDKLTGDEISALVTSGAAGNSPPGANADAQQAEITQLKAELANAQAELAAATAQQPPAPPTGTAPLTPPDESTSTTTDDETGSDASTQPDGTSDPTDPATPPEPDPNAPAQ
jgi:hypothetical protein